MVPPAYAEVVFLENVVTDAVDPQALGRFWETVLGTETLTDEPAGYETRLAVPDGPVLDLCFQRVPEPPAGPQRLQLCLLDADGRARGAAGGLTAPEGNLFRVVEEGAAYADTGPVAALRLEVADPGRDHDFWRWLTGWLPVEGSGLPSLQHPTRRGPLLELVPEAEPKGESKNRSHLDLRLEPGDDTEAIVADIVGRGGRERHFGWGDLPWRHFADPSGNEFCLLPSRG